MRYASVEMKKRIIHWFRQDLRLKDNPALTHAAQNGTVYPVYILDDENAREHKMGGASRWWLHYALESLDLSLDGTLALHQGDAMSHLLALVEEHKIDKVVWNRCYEPWRVARDTHIKSALEAKGVEVESFNGSLLWEPWQALKADGTPYKVFTPYFRRGCLNETPPREPLPTPNITAEKLSSCPLGSLQLLPKIKWDKQLEPHWEISEEGGINRLANFLDNGINHYKEGRNLPAKPFVSRISPYLHFGLLSPNQAWYAARARGDNKNIDHFCSELGWREFSYSLLYHNPTLPSENLQKKFDQFPWRNDPAGLKAWQEGQTGIPIVDAGMRELWQTGFMHNRVRMIVGSFLIKNLMIDWRTGEKWFWDCLVDADLASNSASWQWVAGCGADAAPYFRIFNPITQSQKFDSDGDYIRHYVPELRDLPNKYLYDPSNAPELILKGANITLGKTYPKAIADLKPTRERALAAFKGLKS